MPKILILLLLFTLSGCVNIPLKDVSATPYSDIDFKRPSKKNYKQLESNKTDSTWIHKKNGTIISSKSECSQDSPTLDSYISVIVNDLPETKVIAEKEALFNNRPGKRKIFTAEIDGVKTFFDLVAFKKYGCLFLISRNGLQKGFANSQKDFENFLKSFRVNKPWLKVLLFFYQS